MAIRRINILHLTDFHFGFRSHGLSGELSQMALDPGFVNEVRDHSIRHRFLVFMRRHTLNNPVDAIAFTGDLGVGPERHARTLGADYLAQLAKDIGVHPEHVIVSPGNHDLDRAASDETELDEFCSLCQDRGFTFPSRAEPAVVDHFGPLIIAMNSCLGGTQHALYGGLSEEFWKAARVGVRELEMKFESEQLVNKIQEELSYQVQCMDIPALGYSQIDAAAHAVAANSSNCLIVLLHHNTLPASTTDIRPYANLIDSGQLLVRLMENGRRVILLHGHVHCDSELTVFPIREDMAGGFVASVSSRGLIDRANAAANLVGIYLTGADSFLKASVSLIERVGDDFQCHSKYVLLNRHREMGDIELEVRNALELNKTYAFPKVAELLGKPASEELAEKLIQLDPWPLEIVSQGAPMSNWRINRVQ